MSEAEALPEADRREGAPHPRFAPEVFGHQRAKAEMETALAGQMPHAWLLTGPEGIGKATFAWAFARRLLGPDPGVEARLRAFSEPRLAVIRRGWDDRLKRLKTQITVDEVRKLRDFLGMSAPDGGRRVILIDPADEMNPNAANAVLKLLEEPPANTVFLVVCHAPSRLLPTIRSRCRAMRFDPLGPADLAAALGAAALTIPDRAEAVATLAAGSAGRAVELIEQDGLSTYDRLVALLGTAPDLDRGAALALAAESAGRGNDARQRLLFGLIDTCLARLARSGAGAPLAPAVSAAEAETFARLAPGPAAARLWAERAAELSDRAAHGRAVNLDPSGLILDILVKINETAGRVARP